MRLQKILEIVNQIEKSSFLKILDFFCLELRKSTSQIDKILSEGEGQLKNVDNSNLAKLFNLLKTQYSSHLQEQLKFSDYPLDILVDILIRDGNSIMSREWFFKLYNKEISKLNTNIKTFSSQLRRELSSLDPQRKRDYLVYQSCVQTGYENDLIHNREKHLSWEEKSILHTLSRLLELSNDEIRWLTYSVIPLKKHHLDDIINVLKESGIIFFNRKTNTIFVPDEIIWLLRDIVGIEIPHKYIRRILKNLTDPELNLIAKKHNIDRKIKRSEKIQYILNQGVNLTNLLTNTIFKVNTLKSDKTIRIQTLMRDLEVDLAKSGRSLEEKISNLISYFIELEKDESTSLSRDGYNRLLKDLRRTYHNINSRIKREFELQDDYVLSAELLDDYNIKPRDIIYLLTRNELKNFCNARHIKSRGNLVSNVISAFRDIEDLYIENYELIGCRDLKSLKEKGILVRESELGLLYENVTKKIFKNLGFNIDEKLRKELNTNRLQMDILLNLGNKDVIIIECKTLKDKDYNKFTSISRQLKSYEKLCENKGYHISKLIVVANDFTEDFISACEYDYELNLSLITSHGLVRILEGFNSSSLLEFPVRLFFRNGLLNENRIVNVLNK